MNIMDLDGEDLPEEILIYLRERFLGKYIDIGSEKGLVARITAGGIRVAKEEEIDGRKQIRMGSFRILPYIDDSYIFKEGEEGYSLMLEIIEEVTRK